MPYTQCPICNKRYPDTFIVAHASSCNPSQKRPRANNDLQPRYRLCPAPSSPASETAAPGFHLFPFVFTDIEQSLVEELHTAPPVAWKDYRFRKVKQYGPQYDLRTRRFLFGATAPPQAPFPRYITGTIIPRLRSLPMLANFKPNQVSVAEYVMPDSHIKPHNDCDTGIIKTAVVGVCLGARCTMTLILRTRKSGVGKDVKMDVELPPGAVYVMTGDALRVWEHAIFPRKTYGTRYSLTFRDVSPHEGEQKTCDSPAASSKADTPHIETTDSTPQSRSSKKRLHTFPASGAKRRRFTQSQLK